MPGPLDGLTVLELPALGPVPFVGMLLADLGAQVIRIDRIDAADDPLNAMPVGATGPTGRGRRSIALDLKQPDAVAIVLDLVAGCDVLIEGFRPGVAERLGVGPETVLERNPKLVYGRMTGWGQDGVLAPRAGHDITYLAVSGLLHDLGPKAGPPIPPANYVGDFGGGAMVLATGLLAAVLSARSTGQGQVVDAAMVDGAAYLATMVRSLYQPGLWRDGRENNIFNGGQPHYRCYECADGKYLAVGALEPKFWFTLLQGLGWDPATTASPYDETQHPELIERLTATFKTRTRDDWAAHFEPMDACVAPVLTLAEAPHHPHNAGRASYVEVAGTTVAGPVPRFDRTPAAVGFDPPAIGADTESLLTGLGYPTDRIAELRRARIIA